MVKPRPEPFGPAEKRKTLIGAGLFAFGILGTTALMFTNSRQKFGTPYASLIVVVAVAGCALIAFFAFRVDRIGLAATLVALVIAPYVLYSRPPRPGYDADAATLSLFITLTFLALLLGLALLVSTVIRLWRHPAQWEVEGLPRPPRSPLATPTLVIGVLGGLLAIPLGHYALRQIKERGELGRGATMTGLILGYIWLPFILVWLFSTRP
jgi:hypothetical protein